MIKIVYEGKLKRVSIFERGVQTVVPPDYPLSLTWLFKHYPGFRVVDFNDKKMGTRTAIDLCRLDDSVLPSKIAALRQRIVDKYHAAISRAVFDKGTGDLESIGDINAGDDDAPAGVGKGKTSPAKK